MSELNIAEVTDVEILQTMIEQLIIERDSYKESDFEARKLHFMLHTDHMALKETDKLMKAIIYNLMRSMDVVSLHMDMVDLGDMNIEVDGPSCDIKVDVKHWENETNEDSDET